jgi:hypothetical protein
MGWKVKVHLSFITTAITVDYFLLHFQAGYTRLAKIGLGSLGNFEEFWRWNAFSMEVMILGRRDIDAGGVDLFRPLSTFQRS